MHIHMHCSLAPSLSLYLSLSFARTRGCSPGNGNPQTVRVLWKPEVAIVVVVPVPEVNTPAVYQTAPWRPQPPRPRTSVELGRAEHGLQKRAFSFPAETALNEPR